MRKRASGVSMFAQARGSVTQASWSDVELTYLMSTGWKVGKDGFPVKMLAIPPITTMIASMTSPLMFAKSTSASVEAGGQRHQQAAVRAVAWTALVAHILMTSVMKAALFLMKSALLMKKFRNSTNAPPIAVKIKMPHISAMMKLSTVREPGSISTTSSTA